MRTINPVLAILPALFIPPPVLFALIAIAVIAIVILIVIKLFRFALIVGLIILIIIGLRVVLGTPG